MPTTKPGTPTTRKELIDRYLNNADIANATDARERKAAKQAVDSLLNARLHTCSTTWARNMCEWFDLADGRNTRLRDARMAIQDVRKNVRN